MMMLHHTPFIHHTKKLLPYGTAKEGSNPSITPTNCYLMALLKRSVFVKNVVHEEKESAF